MLKSSVHNPTAICCFVIGVEEEKNSHRTLQSSFNFSWKSLLKHELSWYLTCTYFILFVFVSVINPFYSLAATAVKTLKNDKFFAITCSLPFPINSTLYTTHQIAMKTLKMTNAHMTQEHDNITYINTLYRLNISDLQLFIEIFSISTPKMCMFFSLSLLLLLTHFFCFLFPL